jgi:hypothetical protein
MRFVVKNDQKRNGTYCWWIQDTQAAEHGATDTGTTREVYPDRAVAVNFKEKEMAASVCYQLNLAWRLWTGDWESLRK